MLLCVALAIASHPQTLTPLAAFDDANGFEPSSLTAGADGNFYGTTFLGGNLSTCDSNGCGVIFKMTPAGKLTVIYSFSGPDGIAPEALVQGSDGNFYGTTFCTTGTFHLTTSLPSPALTCGGGTVFKVTPSGTLTTLHYFNGTDGAAPPKAGLIEGSDGNFYGVAGAGGANGQGTVFKLTPGGTLTTLYNFAGPDGYGPVGLMQGADGNFYGTTVQGGNFSVCDFYGCGTVFKLTPSGTLTTLHSFTGADGAYPLAAVVQGSDGNFYGTTSAAGAHQTCLPENYCGTVFKITPSGTLTTLYNFAGQDGASPQAALLPANDGNLYGTTYMGGSVNFGTAFRITPSGTLNTLHHFCTEQGCLDGIGPWAGLVQGPNGLLFGTTSVGGNNSTCNAPYGCGTVFNLTTPSLVATTTVLTTAPNPSTPGQNVTMTGTVTAQDGSLPTGSVLFVANGVGIAIGRLNNSGVAVVSYSTLAIGNNTLMALYQGSPTLAESLSQPIVQVVGGPLASTTAVTSAPNPSTFGQQVMITATVGPAGPPSPTGTVGFSENGGGISGCTAVPVSAQIATCITSALLTGTNAIMATYSGDGNYKGSSGMLPQMENPVPTAVQFVPMPPCRVVDTRNSYGNFGGPAIQGNSSRAFPLSESDNPCGIPASAIAYSLNVTVVPMGPLAYLTIWPTGEGQPVVSNLNSLDGRVKANAAIVPAGVLSGLVSVFVTNTTNVILDINGYFAPPGGTYQFYPLTPCRIVDTRNNQDQGMLQAGVERDYSIAGNCDVPSNATAYSLNVTVLPAAGGLDYLTVWPKGETQPVVSTLNDDTGTVVANAAIVPAGSENATAFYAHSNSTDLLVDIGGYFAAPGTGGLSLYPVAPCRVLDTRQNGGQFIDEKTVNVVGSACAPPANAAAYVFNATVVPPGSMPYLTLWPDGEQLPVVSTLNAYDGFITSNMAIVPTNNGSIDAYAAGLTQLILDTSGYFAP